MATKSRKTGRLIEAERNRWLFVMPYAGAHVLESVVGALAGDAGFAVVDVSALGWPDHPDDRPALDPGARELLETSDRVILGFQRAPVWLPAAMPGHVGVLVIRDPRDTLIAQFHDLAHAAPIPADAVNAARFQMNRERVRSLGLFRWCLEQAPVLDAQTSRWMRTTLKFQCKAFTYEQLFEGWVWSGWSVETLAGYLDLPVSRERASELARAHFPDPGTMPALLGEAPVDTGRVGMWRRQFTESELAELDQLLPQSLGFWQFLEGSMGIAP